MQYEDFIKEIDKSIAQKGYANLSKRLVELLKDETDRRKKVAIQREVTTILLGSGKYALMDKDDGTLIYRSPNFELNQSVIITNENVRVTNDSIRDLNYFQKWVLGISIAFTLLTTIFIILSYFRERNDKSQERLKELVQKEQATLKVLQEIQLSLKELSASMKNVDTVFVQQIHK